MMNRIKSYILAAVAVVTMAGTLSSCQDHFDAPNVNDGPVATMKANTSIYDLKEWLWSNDLNYCDTIYTRDYYLGKTDNPWEGEHIIISGRVTSSDYAGNCFKYIILQDCSGLSDVKESLSFSINSYNLYLEYRRGQEVLVDLTGLFAGKYRGLFQIGFPSWYSSINDYETSFLAPEMFARARELNGLPQIADIDTVLISSFSELGTSPSDLRKWQSQLIRINNVTFSQSSDAAAENITTLSTYHNSGVTQTITASDGSTGAVRTSGYANFWNMELPEGPVDVVLLAGYYGSNETNAAYQFTLIDANGIITDATLPVGSKDNPYTIGEAIELQADPSKPVSGWVSGYIVGTVGPEVTDVESDEDIDWTDAPLLGNTMVIGPTPDCTDVTKCLVIELPQGSDIYNQSIRAKAENYHKAIAVNGTFQSVLGTFGVVTNGASSNYEIEGNEMVVPEGVYTVAEALDLINSGNIPSEKVQVMGIISSIKEIDTSSYGNATYYIVDKPGDSNSLTVYRGYYLNGAKFTAADQIKAGDVVIVEGTLVNYMGNTPEMEQGNKIVSLNGSSTGGSGSGGGSGTITPGGSPGTETFKDGIGLPEKAASAPSSPTNYTSSATGITYNIMGCYVSAYSGSSYLMINGKNFSGAFISFALAFDCGEIVMKTSSACSTNAASKVNVYANDQLIGEYPANVQNSNVTVAIPSQYQAAGTVYKVQSATDSYNQQFVSFTYVQSGSESGGDSGSGSGSTSTEAISVTEAISKINSGYEGEATVKGVVSSVGSFNSQYGELTYFLVDEGKTEELQIYNGLGLNGDKFTSANDVQVGATVVVKGTIKNYNGTPEMNYGSIILSYTPPTGGGSTGGSTGGGSDTPSTPSGDDSSETFQDGLGFPEKAASATAFAKDYTSSATGITYTIMGCYLTTYSGSSYLMINGKNYSGAFISWKLGYACSKLELTTSGSCSTNAASKVKVYANDKLIGEYAANEQNSIITVDIPPVYQAAGNIYRVESATDSYNQQFTKFTYVKAN